MQAAALFDGQSRRFAWPFPIIVKTQSADSCPIHVLCRAESSSICFTALSKSEVICWCLLNASYSVSAFSFAAFLEILPLSFKISYLLNARNSLTLAENSSIVNVFSRSIKSSILLNYSNFSSSCFFLQLLCFIYFFQMIINRVTFNTEQLPSYPPKIGWAGKPGHPPSPPA